MCSSVTMVTLQVVVEEVQKLAELNAKLSLEAHRTEEDIVNTETALRNNLTMLRKTLQDEIQSKTSLSNKMESETEDFEKYQGDSSRKLSRVCAHKRSCTQLRGNYYLLYLSIIRDLKSQISFAGGMRDQLSK